MTEHKEWDNLTEIFSSDVGEALAADNQKIAWPVILTYIPRQGKILDFGCGAGNFCNYLGSMGYEITGIDPAPKMVDAAQKLQSKANFIKGDYRALPKNTNFNAITATMVLQFIADKDLEATVDALGQAMEENGIIIVTVYNPQFAKLCLKEQKFFSIKNGQITTNYHNDISVDTFIRTEEEYKRIFERIGLIFQTSHRPPFTKEFVEQYNWTLPYKVPEYIIMVFKKV